jgi:transcription initiation factor TFIIF subunit beta
MAEHTEYVAAPDHEVHCTPRENEEWQSLQARKAALERAKRPETLLTHIGAKDLAMSTVASDFLRVAEAARRPRGAGAHESKALRLDETVLLDILADKFRQYRFWPLRRLREETRQPEAHLREVLGKIAILVKTGQAANMYMLKPQMAAAVDMREDEFAVDDADVKQEEIAPDEWSGQELDSMDEDDDDDDDMEDVPL